MCQTEFGNIVGLGASDLMVESGLRLTGHRGLEQMHMRIGTERKLARARLFKARLGMGVGCLQGVQHLSCAWAELGTAMGLRLCDMGIGQDCECLIVQIEALVEHPTLKICETGVETVRELVGSVVVIETALNRFLPLTAPSAGARLHKAENLSWMHTGPTVDGRCLPGQCECFRVAPIRTVKPLC